jgi:GTP-binding protein EngB required for normal cell division/uncharacterized protein (DUF697 family)
MWRRGTTLNENIKEAAQQLRKKIEAEQKDKLKIALFGQPGAGKSSLINRIVGQNVAKSGAGTDITVDAQVIEYGDLVFVDLPGYGTSKYPPNNWFDQFKPTDYDLFLCVFSGKFHEADTTFFKQLKNAGRVCLFVRNKHDDLWQDGKETHELEEEISNDVERQVGSAQKVFFVSCRKQTGLDEIVKGIQNALDPAKKEKYARSAKAYSKEHLEAKRAACEKLVYTFAGLSAANGLNPIIGLDVGVDLSIMLSLFAQIRSAYGLSDEKINNLGPALLPLGKKVIDLASKEGALLLLKRFGTAQVTKEIAKWVPFVGQAIAAAAGFGMTLAAGRSYLNDCHELATQILDQELAVPQA